MQRRYEKRCMRIVGNRNFSASKWSNKSRACVRTPRLGKTSLTFDI